MSFRESVGLLSVGVEPNTDSTFIGTFGGGGTGGVVGGGGGTGGVVGGADGISMSCSGIS